MTFNEFQENTRNTANGDDDVANWALGLAGETGEVVEHIKKYLYHGAVLEKEELCGELGDLLWYAAVLASSFGINLDDVARTNVAKLQARYPTGFVAGGGSR